LNRVKSGLKLFFKLPWVVKFSIEEEEEEEIGFTAELN
jgi:hypothetical protein